MHHRAPISAISSLLGLGGLLAACAGEVSSESLAGQSSALSSVPQVPSTLDTPPLHGYDDAPRAVDSDDPAIWVNASQPDKSLVIGALKDAGLQVYDLAGHVLQTIVPPNRPP
jgi:3-phytase